MPTSKTSRREFLATSGSAVGGSWMALQLPVLLATADLACQARESGAAFKSLSLSEAAGLEAMASQIIPSGETPGASEAGVIFLIDQALHTFMANSLPQVRKGIEELNELVKEKFSAEAFNELSWERQTEALSEIDSTPFFGLVRLLTVAGMFSHPKHGGNRDEIGWNLIGFDPQGAWQPPFGHYDAQPGNEVTDG